MQQPTIEKKKISRHVSGSLYFNVGAAYSDIFKDDVEYVTFPEKDGIRIVPASKILIQVR